MKPLPAWPCAYGGPFGSGRLKFQPEDFQVQEHLGFVLSGTGEHVFLLVEKRGLNTEQVAEALAHFAGVPRSQVSYAGLKDRHALVQQWFSVHLPGKREVPWTECVGEGFRVMGWTRHQRKLKRGALAGNRFGLRLRKVQGDRERLEATLCRIKAEGMPNYFGAQRFGHEGANLYQAEAWLRGEIAVRSRYLRSLYLSAARSWLFNQVLATRVARGDWHRPLPGDWLLFDGSGAGFLAETVDLDLQARAAALALHPSGPLWGQGRARASLVAGQIEQQVIDAYRPLALGLEAQGVKGMRRPLRVQVQELDWQWQGLDLHLSFALPAGAYATSLVRELVEAEL